ncbi:MAG: LPS export ABC transporter periplasmic protein LptC [Gammaproteobacteria bacterium]|nr:LPS export ABC transporter periplasmic protein LptC [Gammaproteobacteria bacterium]
MALGLWMQTLLVKETDFTAKPLDVNDPDFFMENVVLNGKDASGNRYRIETGRLVHYPSRNGSSLESPRLTQYRSDGTIQNVESNRGWLDNGKQVLTLSEDVRIRNQSSNQSSSLSITEQLVIHLKKQGIQS